MDRTAWIAVVLCVAGLFGWGAWSAREQADYAREMAAWKAEQAELAEAEAEKAAKEGAATGNETTSGAVPTAAGKEAQPAATAAATVDAKEVTLEGDTIRVHFTNQGGGIATAEMLDHQRTLEEDEGYVIINERATQPIGALSAGPGQFDQGIWEISEQTKESIAFKTVTPENLEITKRFALPGADVEPHLLTLTVTVKNAAEQQQQVGRRFLYLGAAAPLYEAEFPRQTGFYFRDEESGDVTYKPVDYFKGKKFLGIGSDAKPHDEFSITQMDWAGVNDQFFTTLLTPDQAYETTVWASRFPILFKDQQEPLPEKKRRHAVEAAMGLPNLTLAPGDQQSINYELYLGPKEYHRLKELGDHRTMVMKYDDTPIFGWMFGWAIRPLASVLIQILVWLKGIVGLYGIAIILVTILIRIVIWPVYAKSTRTMKRMSKLTPMMNDIKEKYKDDQERQSKELMKLYGDYGVNPLGGCLPMFIQLPVFLAFYGMLWRAAELRHESFLWVPDLSMPDTLFIIPGIGLPFNLLPILMAGTTFIQMSMTPKTGDKTQQMVFKFMPIFFLVICYNFASALALYWTTQNVFSIFQTWLMNKLPEPELKKKKRKNGKSFMERLQDQAQAQQAAKNSGGGGAAPAAGADRTKLSSEKGDRHTKSRKKKRR